MGVILNRRINLGGGIGLNLSKSGLSTSIRHKYGSIGTSGYSLKSGIPGLFLRRYSNKKDKGMEILFVILCLGIFLLLAFLIYHAIKFSIYLIGEFFKLVRRKIIEKRIHKEVTMKMESTNFLVNNGELYPMQEGFSFSTNIHNRSHINEGSLIGRLKDGNHILNIKSTTSGIIEFYVENGEQVSSNQAILGIIKKSL